MNGWRRFLSLLLSAVLLLGTVPGTALAESCHEHHDEDCGYQESSPGVPCDHVCDESCAVCAHICDEGCAEGCVHVCGEGCAVCAHTCPDGCAYEAATEGAPCGHSCEVCTVTTVSSWTWVDPEENLEDGELSLPGVSEANAVDFATVLELLPAAVSTEFGELPVEFTCPEFPEAATGGEYLFTATLPEGYILAGEAAPLTVKVILGGAEPLAGNEYTSGYWKYAIYVGSNLVGITGYTGSSTTVTVPSTLGGYPVNDIGAYVFSETNVKTVTIPSSVTKINSYAFRNADSLQTVTIQGGPTIDTGAFYDCDALTTVKLGTTTLIGQDAFCGCDKLTSITIPSSVTTIGRYAFTASGLTSITFASGSRLSNIGISAFSSTPLTTITLPAGATLEDGRVFSNCRDLTSINVSGTTTYKSVDGVLYSANGKTLVSYPRAKAGEVYQIPAGTTTVGPYAFCGYNSSLTNLTPGTLKSLRKVMFPPSITTLNDRAFYTDTSIKYCFCGNAPSIGSYPLSSGTVWYTEGRTGWSSSFANRTATPWPPEEHVTRVLETYPATCGAPGTAKKECTLCGFVATVEDPNSPATGDHIWKGIGYSQVYLYIEPFCTVCDLSYKVKLEAPADCTYTGGPIEAVLTGTVPEGVGTWTITYGGSGLVDGKPVQPGNYRATLSWSNEWNNASIYVNYDIVVAAEETPEAVIDYYYEQLWCLDPGATYLINGTEYTADEVGYMPLDQDWIGTTLTIIKKSTDPNVLDSEPQTLVVPDRPGAPEGIIAVAESLKGAGDGKLLNVDYSMDYRYDYSGWMMITGDTLEHLKPGTYEVRYSSDGFKFASRSVFVTVEEGPLPTAGTPEAKLDFENEALTGLTPEGSYEINGNDYTADENGRIPLEESWLGGDIVIIQKGEEGLTQDSEAQVISAPARREAPEGITAEPESVKGAADGRLLNVDSSMEYRVSGGEWLPVYGTSVEGLAPGTYEVRYRATDSSFTSPSVFVTVEEGPLPNAKTPAAALDFESEALTGLTPEDSYAINGNDYTADENGRIPLEESWLGGDIVIIQKGEEGLTQDSEAQVISAPARREAPEAVTAQAESVKGMNDGKLLNVDTTMEYRVAGGDWLPVYGTSVEGLAPGTYEVRYAATDTGFASPAITVTVEEGPLPIAETPDVKVNYTAEWLMNLHPDCSYTVNGELFIADINGTIPLKESWLGTQITVILKGEEGKTQDSAPCRVDLPARPQAPKGVTAQDASLQGRFDGKLLNVDPYMEYRTAGGDWTKIAGPTVEGLAPGTYEVRYKATDTAFASPAVTVTIGEGKVSVSLTHGDIPRQLWTGKAVKPKVQLNFTRSGKTLKLTEGKDYTLTYKNNVDVGNATVTVAPAKDGKYHFDSVTLIFQIGYGAKISGVPKNSTVWLDGVAKTLDGDILWLEEPTNAFITTYSFHNAGAEDIHTVYPTGMTVWELRGTEAKRLKALDDALLYGGTSIRTTGNQGIRFITSVPKSLKNSLKKGLEGYTLVEYGTLMGWYAPGTDLIWGVNAKSVAYSKADGTDAIFAQTNTTVQFTGMLTDLDLKQSTRDLMTRPYMVLEKDGKQIVLYGGQLVRSIGYVAIQNKNVFRKGSADYEFIWKIIQYAYPDIYKAEYGK